MDQQATLPVRAKRVAFIGGHDRVARQIVPFGAEIGVEVEIHNGHAGGGGRARLSALLQRTDLVIVVTGTNSHNAVHIARREAARAGIEVRLVKSLGAGSARALLREIARAA
jgi:hypothetical protein